MDNHFTISYIRAVKDCLNVEFNSENAAVFYPDRISIENIKSLKIKLDEIWNDSETAINILKTQEEATVQMGLFGLINDLELALKVGFTLGDRIVLIDYLHDRILSKEPQNIDIQHLGSIASNLVNCLTLAEIGRIVIIPNPFGWNSDSKKIIIEASNNITLTPELLSLLNMLSITKICHLHPYTITESKDRYNKIVDNHLDYTDLIGRSGGIYAYEGILGALLSERVLNETELKIVLDLPINRYYEIISQNKDFYSEYISALTKGGALNIQNNMNKLKESVNLALHEKNEKIKQRFQQGLDWVGGIGAGTISVLGTVSAVSSPLVALNAIFLFSPLLFRLLGNKDNKGDPVISVFSNLLEDKL